MLDKNLITMRRNNKHIAIQSSRPLRICTLLAIIFYLLSPISLSAQNVSNVNAEQQGKTIVITYDLDKAADISVYMSTSSGRTYRELHHVTGDVGKTVGPGHKTIVWDVLDEVEDLVGDNIVFMVRVDANAEARWKKLQHKEYFRNMPTSTFFTLNAAYSPMPQWSYGFKVGQVQLLGWYVSAMSNFQFKGIYHPFPQEQIYGLVDRKTVRLSLQGGFAVRPWKPMTLLFGVGYGYRTLVYQDMNETWYSYPKRTFHGVDASFGFLFDIKGFALSAEAVTTNFQTVEARVGVGFCLPNNKSKKQTVKVVKR